ncbi:MAG: ion transporter [Nannocystaceae bacterium]|nr:ion transporter [Myxococcales bacterium]
MSPAQQSPRGPSIHGRHRPREVGWRIRTYRIIFEAETPAGRRFDIALLAAILLSVVVVVLESTALGHSYHGGFLALEWTLTALFTIEYAVRLYCVRKPLRYALSFYGLVDLLAVLPTYLALFFEGTHSLMVIRTLRLLRVFRLLKLTHFIGEAHSLIAALRASRHKITVFLGVVGIVVVIVGTVMYLVEGQAESGFDSIPKSMYWAIVTMTTVGYGDIAPKTALGQAIAAMLMIAGYGIIAVPTGIVTAELVSASEEHTSTRVCPECSLEGHGERARFCRECGAQLEDGPEEPPLEPEGGGPHP